MLIKDGIVYDINASDVVALRGDNERIIRLPNGTYAHIWRTDENEEQVQAADEPRLMTLLQTGTWRVDDEDFKDVVRNMF